MSRTLPAHPGLRQSMSWIHGWLGLLAGWLLFAMFLTGTVSFFRPEITRWMQPEIRATQADPRQAAEAAVAYLQRTYAGDRQWIITVPDGRLTATRVFTQAQPPAAPSVESRAPLPRRPELRLDPATGEPLQARETRGGEHFYRFHFQLQLPHPWGRWLAGICAMFMLGAIISGVITHRRIVADFFTLRWGKGQRSWLDAHNASAVLALPFHAMITYTGLVTLITLYMPWPIAANYASSAAFGADAFGREEERPASGTPAPLTAVGPLLQAARQEWDGGRPSRIVVRHPGDAAATVTVQRSGADTLNARGASITYSGVDGRRLSATPAPGPAIETAGVMLGLHMGWFAGPLLRWTYFGMGLVGTAMVGTGLLLWTAARRRPGARPFLGLHLVERLNIGTVACLPAGMAAFLLANRLLPADLAGRAAMEVSAMYWVWFGLAALSLLRPARRAWAECFGLSALACALVPVVNAATTDRGFLRSVAAGDGLFVAFDLALLSSAALLGVAAWRSSRLPRAQRRGRQAAPPSGTAPDNGDGGMADAA